MRSDRNLYSKNLIESQDEIAEMKRKFKIMNHQIEQLKEEIGQGPGVREGAHRAHEGREGEGSAEERADAEAAQVFTSEAAMKNFEAERAKLDRIIDDADRERFRQKTECASVSTQLRRRGEAAPASPAARRETGARTDDIVINERDILGTQLIRRNDELALLYEKMKTQQRTISKVFGASKATARAPSRARLAKPQRPPPQGELAYRERLEDLRVLRLKASALRRELHIAKSQTHNLSSLREEVYRLQLEARARVEPAWRARRAPALARRARVRETHSRPSRPAADAGAHQGQGVVRGARESEQQAPLAQARGLRPRDL